MWDQQVNINGGWTLRLLCQLMTLEDIWPALSGEWRYEELSSKLLIEDSELGMKFEDRRLSERHLSALISSAVLTSHTACCQ
jgi:hypothetical protein